MEETSLETFRKISKRRNTIRWSVVLFFFVFITAITIIALANQIESETFYIIYTVIILGGAVLVFGIVIFPFFRTVEAPTMDDGKLVPASEPQEEVFLEEIRNTIIYWFTIPFALLFFATSFTFLFEGDYVSVLIFVIVVFFFVSIAVLFDRLVIMADKEQVVVAMGPLRAVLSYDQIRTIRPIAIKPWKEYMGFGKRLGPDGSIGYIIPIKTGVRMEIANKSPLVVTMRKTQEFTNFVRYHRNNQA